MAPAAIPRAPMREESGITAFDKKVGDSSRSVLIVVLLGAAILLAGVFYFASPPPEVQQEAQEETRHALPKDLVKAVLTQPSKDKPASENAPDQAAPDQEANPAEGAASAEGQTPQTPMERIGRLTINTEPAVDVYDGNDLIGRTPLTAKLTVGPHKLRFTDKKTGLNTYRSYKVHGGEQKDDISFGTSKLLVEAPNGASILLNSRVVGKAPLDAITIYEGKYHLKVTLDGKSWADWFDAPPGRTINYKVTLHE
jgi:hypothetical protein